MTKDAPLLGIDFGTSQSSMAWFNPRTGQAEVIRNAEGEDKTPSVVYYGDGETLVGKPAEDLLENEHERGRILFGVKRHLAKRVRYALGDRHIRPGDVVADILRKLKRDAEDGHFREAVTRAVITHPAVFDQLENDLLAEAAKEAGFAEVVLLPEPVAAAIAYAEAGLNVGDHVLVFDLGGGTFDLALLNRGDADEPFTLAAEPRGLRCGGDDFDQALYDHCDAVAQQTLGRPIGTKDLRDLHFLRECRRRKENLSVRTRSEFSSYLRGGVQFKHAIDRESFERLIDSAVQPTVSLTRSILDEAASEGRKPKAVVLIGGSSQVPLVQRLLREALSIEPVKWQGRDLAVALGAAYHARRLWMRRWHTEPIATSCPKCHEKLASHLSGQIKCAKCQWEFEINDAGGVVAGQPIAASCPSCAEQLILRRSGETQCPKCRWQFEINDCGNVVAGKPIATDCPKCDTRWHVRQPDWIRCAKCQWQFQINEAGDVVAGRPVAASCPSCSEKLELSQPGRVQCFKCQWQFEINDNGAVIAGRPIAASCPNCGVKVLVRHPGHIRCADCQWDYQINESGTAVGGQPIVATCPHCDTTLHLRQAGNVQCCKCNCEFEIAGDGEVLELLREKVLRDPLNKALLQRYIEKRGPSLRAADQALQPTELVFTGVAKGWREKLCVGPIGGYVIGAVAGLVLGMVLFVVLKNSDSAAGFVWPVLLWAVITGIGAFCFIQNYDDQQAKAIRDSFNGSIGGFFKGIGEWIAGGSLAAVLGVMAAFFFLALPVAIIVILIVVLLLSAVIAAVIGFIFSVLLTGAVGAAVGFVIGGLVSVLWGTIRGALGGLDTASTLRSGG